jgi:molybdate transport system substrate-binding protein
MSRFRTAFCVASLLAAVSAAFAQSQPAAGGEERELIVFAAASLREAFEKMSEAFKREHPGVEVTFNFAGSQELRVQIESGAAVDVFASADRRNLNALRAGRWVEAERIFARNEPVLAVPSAGGGAIFSFEDLPKAKRIVVAAPEVPIGGYTVQTLERAYRQYGDQFRKQVQGRIASNELNVRQVLAKVRLGEADAGIVYRSDVASIGTGVRAIRIPEELNVTAEYPVAMARAARHRKLAAAWIDLMTSPQGQMILGRFGFLSGTPGASRRTP